MIVELLLPAVTIGALGAALGAIVLGRRDTTPDRSRNAKVDSSRRR